MNNEDYKKLMLQLIDFDIENKIDRFIVLNFIHMLELHLLEQIKEDIKDEDI